MEGRDGCCFALERSLVGSGYWWSVWAWSLTHRMDILCGTVAITGGCGGGDLGLPACSAMMIPSACGSTGRSSGHGAM